MLGLTFKINNVYLQGIITSVNGDCTSVARAGSDRVVVELDGRSTNDVIDSADVRTRIFLEDTVVN